MVMVVHIVKWGESGFAGINSRVWKVNRIDLSVFAIFSFQRLSRKSFMNIDLIDGNLDIYKVGRL